MPEHRCIDVTLGKVLRAGMLALIASLLLATPAAASKYAALVVDADSGRVYYSRRADELKHPASLTKMMTLYMVFEALDAKRIRMNTPIPVSKYASRRPPSKLRLRVGQTITVEDAILALVTKSANDVATAVAEKLGGTESKFARMMTKRARALGMSRTTFGNASGLPHRAQRSTARDMVVLALALRRDFPRYYNYFQSESFTYHGRTYRNHNNLLGKFEGTVGIKTGYTNAAGFNLVAAVDRGEHRLIGVVFGGRTARTRDSHMRRLLGRVFYQLERSPHIITPERVPVPLFRPTETARASLAEVAALESGVPIPSYRPGTEPPILPHAQGSADDDADITGWAIQLGAYSDYKRASQVARMLAKEAPDLASDGVSIEPMRHQGTRLFRARIGGDLTEREARGACTRLERSDLPCVPIAPDA